jgi:uncharacterized tellurite resistance protein B-like protein
MKFSDILTGFRQGKGTARSHMKNLIEMAAADGTFAPAEMDLLNDIAKRNGINEKQIADIRKNPGTVAFELPTEPKEKFSQLFDLALMMSVDKSVHVEERRLCTLFAIKFGYKRENVTELVTTIQANINSGRDMSETMKRCEVLIA